jgi:hypothetical protein
LNNETSTIQFMSRVQSFVAVRNAICQVGRSGIGLYVQEKGTNLIYYSHAGLKKRSGMDLSFSNGQKLDWSKTYSIADPAFGISIVILKNKELISVSPFVCVKHDIDLNEPIWCVGLDPVGSLINVTPVESLKYLEENSDKCNHIKNGSLIFNNTWTRFFGIRI